jgi:hypothetical protein
MEKMATNGLMNWGETHRFYPYAYMPSRYDVRFTTVILTEITFAPECPLVDTPE